MSNLAKLIAQYKSAGDDFPQKDRAELEKQIWQLYVDSQKAHLNVYDRRVWCKATLGVVPADFEMRSQLLRSGAWVDPLWGLVDQGSPLRIAIRLLREATDAVRNAGSSHDQAISDAITAYQNFGHVSHTKDGKMFRKNPPRPPAKEEFSADDTQNTRSRVFASQVKDLAAEYVRTSLHEFRDLEEIEMQKPADEFVSFVTEACEDLRRRITTLRAQGRKDARRQKVGRDGLRRACEVLGISAVYNRPINLVAAKRIMLRRAGALHPDKHGGSHNTRSEYQAVIEAYKVLEDYMEGLKSHANGNGERDHEGR